MKNNKTLIFNTTIAIVIILILIFLSACSTPDTNHVDVKKYDLINKYEGKIGINDWAKQDKEYILNGQ